jgi:serine protease Do
MAGVGKKVAVKVFRNGHETMVTLKLAEFPSEEEKVAATQPDGDEGAGLGLVVADITPALQRQLELDQAAGVVVKTVDPASPAGRAGLSPGDVIRSINGQNVNRARELKQIVEKTEVGSLLRLQVIRQGTRRFVAIRKPGK